ncbi:MAG: MarR family winged helix-turn-helix transcriptional regulator [Clostridiaceae bacterium]
MRTKETLESIVIWFKISKIYNENIKETNRLLKEYGLSSAQFDVLAQIGVGKEITQSDLSEKLLATKGNISQLIVSMENKDYVRRRQEWKNKYVSLTSKGTDMYNELVPLVEAFQTETFGILDEEERQVLLTLLRKVERKIK